MRRWGSTWATVGLVVLAALAVVLSWAAIDSTYGRGAQAPLASVITEPTRDADPGGDEDDQEVPDRSQGSAPGQDLEGDDGEDDAASSDGLPAGIEPPLVMVSRSIAYRASVGSCTGGATVDRSTTAGAQWTEVMTPAVAVLDLMSSRGDDVRLLGADATCDVSVWTSTDSGETWSAPESAAGVFVRVPGDPSVLLTPTGVVPNPCPVAEEAPVSVEGVSPTFASVLCTSGDVLLSTDGGNGWVTRSPVVGGVAMTFESPDVGWALRVNSGQCAAYQVMKTQDRALTWQTGGCVGRRASDVSSSGAAVSFSDRNRGMAVAGGATYLTSDSGLTWERAG
jgi:hypothetical protein